jgi:hypothetical protein
MLISQKPASVPHKVLLKYPEPTEHGSQTDNNPLAVPDLDDFPDLDSMQDFDLDDLVEAVLVPFAPIMVTRLMMAVASFILLLSENVCRAIYVLGLEEVLWGS